MCGQPFVSSQSACCVKDRFKSRTVGRSSARSRAPWAGLGCRHAAAGNRDFPLVPTTSSGGALGTSAERRRKDPYIPGCCPFDLTLEAEGHPRHRSRVRLMRRRLEMRVYLSDTRLRSREAPTPWTIAPRVDALGIRGCVAARRPGRSMWSSTSLTSPLVRHANRASFQGLAVEPAPGREGTHSGATFTVARKLCGMAIKAASPWSGTNRLGRSGTCLLTGARHSRRRVQEGSRACIEIEDVQPSCRKTLLVVTPKQMS